MHVHLSLLSKRQRTMLTHVRSEDVAKGRLMESDQVAPRAPVLEFAESDYCYGTGPLLMRVEHIDWNRPVLYDNENFYQVDGIEITSDGREIGRRQALVRGRRLAVNRQRRR
jgi:hypothetical protein